MNNTTRKKPINFTLLHTNDEHSALLPISTNIESSAELADSSLGGIARLGYTIKKMKNNIQEPVLTLSSGDFMGGTPFSWLNYKNQAPELQILKHIGYDAITFGNHEYDYGLKGLLRCLKAAGYPEAKKTLPLVVSNTEFTSDNQFAELGIQKYHLKELGENLKIGLLGLIGEAATKDVTHLNKINFFSVQQTIRKKIGALKEKGADLIIVLSHSGLSEDRKLAKIKGIDIIIGGHSHNIIRKPINIQGTIIVQTGDNLRYLGCLKLCYNPLEKTLKTRNEELNQPFLIPLNNEITPDKKIKNMVTKYYHSLNDLVCEKTNGRVTDIKKELAYTSFPLKNKTPGEETPLGNLMADGLRLTVEEKLNQKIDCALIASNFLKTNVISRKDEKNNKSITFYDLTFLTSIGSGFDDNPGYPVTVFYVQEKHLWKLMELSLLINEMANFKHFTLLDDPSFKIHTSGLRFTYTPRLKILFTIPGIKLPIPTFRAIRSMEIFTKKGRQDNSAPNFTPLKRKGNNLIRVTALYDQIAYLLTLKNSIPFFEFKIRTKTGQIRENLKETIIRISENQELKLWHTLLNHFQKFPQDKEGRTYIPDYYSSTQGRVNKKGLFSKKIN